MIILATSKFKDVPLSEVDLQDGAVVTINQDYLSVVYPFNNALKGFQVSCSELRDYLLSLDDGQCFQYHAGGDGKRTAGFSKHVKTANKPDDDKPKSIGEAFAGNASKG